MERYLLIRALGAEVRLSDPELKSQGFLDLAKRIAKETPNAYLLSQFTNESNPNAHYENTGPELWKQTNGSIDAFVAGAGAWSLSFIITTIVTYTHMHAHRNRWYGCRCWKVFEIEKVILSNRMCRARRISSLARIETSRSRVAWYRNRTSSTDD